MVPEEHSRRRGSEKLSCKKSITPNTDNRLNNRDHTEKESLNPNYFFSLNNPSLNNQKNEILECKKYRKNSPLIVEIDINNPLDKINPHPIPSYTIIETQTENTTSNISKIGTPDLKKRTKNKLLTEDEKKLIISTFEGYDPKNSLP